MNNYGEHPKIQWFMIYLKVFDELILTHYLPQKEKEKTYIVEYLYIYICILYRYSTGPAPMAMARHEDALELLKQAVALLVGDVRAEIHEAIGQLKLGEARSRGAVALIVALSYIVIMIVIDK